MRVDLDPNKKGYDVKVNGEKQLYQDTSGIEETLSKNDEPQDEFLKQVGIDDKGNVIEGSLTDKAMDVQKENTDFVIDTIEQQKKDAESEYAKEQSSAYVDYKKQINPYGTQAEQLASQGLDNSGYAESLKTQAYVAHQNRVAVSRESYNRIVQDFNNQIAQARLQNNSALADIYNKAMVQRLQYLLETGIVASEGTISRPTANNSVPISKYQEVYDQLLYAQQMDAALTGKAKPQRTEPTIDMQSIYNLGYGQINAETLDMLIRQGKVEEYVENGMLKYRNVVN